MRSIITLAAAASASALLAACATAPVDNPSYQAELETLEQECTARGGVLQALGNSITAHPRADYACRLQDATRTDG